MARMVTLNHGFYSFLCVKIIFYCLPRELIWNKLEWRKFALRNTEFQ